MKKRIVFTFIIFLFAERVSADSTLVDTTNGIDTVLFEKSLNRCGRDVLVFT